ncbi:DUF6296 family protein [Kitasatospora sp. NPDC050467]|uniref:DUF6296 family protein n=1 Tax=unclassified Kitasatospora TaxID=2633591 RepID=UPI00379B104F
MDGEFATGFPERGRGRLLRRPEGPAARVRLRLFVRLGAGPTRYAVTLPGPPGAHRPPDVVVVRPNGETTTDGNPVSADVAGTLRAEILGEVARISDRRASTGSAHLPARHRAAMTLVGQRSSSPWWRHLRRRYRRGPAWVRTGDRAPPGLVRSPCGGRARPSSAGRPR